MKRIVVLPADLTACGYYRLRLPAGAVQQIRPDWKVEVYRPDEVMLQVGVNGELWGVQGLPDPNSIDLLVMQRVATRAQVDLFKWAIKQGIATVMDSDDAMWCIDPENMAYLYWNSTQPGRANWRHLDEAAALADLVTTTTDSLAKRYGKHGRAEVLPNCVPGDMRDLLKSVRGELDPTPTVGWAGFTTTHPRDLTVCGDAVRNVQEDTGCLLRVVGDAAGAARDWDVPFVETVSPTDIGMPYYTALTTLDVGLVPLRNTPFNRAKSYLKALEFAAVGVPVVASDTPAMRLLAKTVPIILADTPNDWYQGIHRLIEDADFRKSRARWAQDAVFALHTYEANALRWAEVWERAMARREKMTA